MNVLEWLGANQWAAGVISTGFLGLATLVVNAILTRNKTKNEAIGVALGAHDKFSTHLMDWIKTLEAQVCDLREENEKWADERDDMRRKMSDMQSEIDEARRTSDRRAFERGELESKVRALTNELEEYKRQTLIKAHERQALEREVATLKLNHNVKVAELQAQIETLERTIRDLSVRTPPGLLGPTRKSAPESSPGSLPG